MSTPDDAIGPGEAHALDLLHRAAGPLGFAAAIGGHSHYQRIWTRDGAIASLAAVASNDGDLIGAAERTLDTIAAAPGRHGEIPSNVGADGPSYGGIVGRVDAPLWYAIAVGAVAPVVGTQFARRHGAVVSRVLDLIDSWELNGRGLVPVPMAGTWADEYVASGYLLDVQLLRVAALRSGLLPDGSRGPDDARARTASEIVARLELDYWSDPETRRDPRHYHPVAYRAVATRHRAHWLAGFDAAGYTTRFDALANTLAIGLGLGSADRQAAVLAFVDRLSGRGLIPAFAPLIGPGDPDWRLLRNNHRFGFRNNPGAYHNGGLWPWISGLWAAAIARLDPLAARSHAAAIDAANSLGPRGRPGGWAFAEFHNAATGRPGGVMGVTWNAAGSVLARSALRGTFSIPGGP